MIVQSRARRADGDRVVGILALFVEVAVGAAFEAVLKPDAQEGPLDCRDDAAYKAKVQELIERNKEFEREREERDRVRGSGLVG